MRHWKIASNILFAIFFIITPEVFSSECKIPPTTFFHVLIEEKSDNIWEIQQIAENQKLSVSSPKKQELLYISPTYEKVEPDFGKGKFDCDASERQKKGWHEGRTYNPCDSKLTKINAGETALKKTIFTVFSLGVAALMETNVKAVDEEKLSAIIKQTNLIEKIKEYKKMKDSAQCECQKTQEEVKYFFDKIVIAPQIIDRSGFYINAKIVEAHKEIVNSLTCPIDLKEITYTISIRQVDRRFNINIEPNFYTLKYNLEGYFLKPTVIITSKNFSQVYPVYTNEDKSVLINFDSEKIWFTNKTEQFIQIKSLAIYYNGEISNINLGERSIELAPNATLREPLHIGAFSLENIQKMSNYKTTKDTAASQNILFGFAIKYRLVEQNIDRTLYKQNKYNLFNILKSKS